MKDAAEIFLGTHDFRNFADEEKEKSSLCDIKGISVLKEGDWIYLDIAASRFLQHMVRKIATALKLIGKGEKNGAWLAGMLDLSMSDRLPPLDAHGLILKDIKYPDLRWEFDTYARDRAVDEIHELFMSHEITAKILEMMENGMK